MPLHRSSSDTTEKFEAAIVEIKQHTRQLMQLTTPSIRLWCFCYIKFSRSLIAMCHGIFLSPRSNSFRSCYELQPGYFWKHFLCMLLVVLVFWWATKEQMTILVNHSDCSFLASSFRNRLSWSINPQIKFSKRPRSLGKELKQRKEMYVNPYMIISRQKIFIARPLVTMTT